MRYIIFYIYFQFINVLIFGILKILILLNNFFLNPKLRIRIFPIYNKFEYNLSKHEISTIQLFIISFEFKNILKISIIWASSKIIRNQSKSRSPQFLFPIFFDLRGHRKI
jgi:hypothetical protein